MSPIVLALSLSGISINEKIMLGSCLNCHSSTISEKSTIPIISGLPAWYTQKRLFELKRNKNYYGAMSLIAKGLSNEEINKYSLVLSKMEQNGDVLKTTRRYKSNCGSCHQKGGFAPYLQYQNPAYLRVQITRYITGERKSGNSMLRAIESHKKFEELFNPWTE